MPPPTACSRHCTHCPDRPPIEVRGEALDMALIEVCSRSGSLGKDHLPCMIRLLESGADPRASFNGVSALGQRSGDSDAVYILHAFGA